MHKFKQGSYTTIECLLTGMVYVFIEEPLGGLVKIQCISKLNKYDVIRIRIEDIKLNDVVNKLGVVPRIFR